jgi:PilZ domain-containing protein
MRFESQKKRVQRRYSISARFRASQLPLHESHRKSQAFEGKVKNISDGGFCVIATQAPEKSKLLQGRLLLPRMPAQIPTLVQVRWVEKAASGRHYRIGLQYVL